MYRAISTIFAIALFLAYSDSVHAQVDDICGEFGVSPLLDAPRANLPYVYGRVTFKGLDPAGKFPKVTVVLIDREQSANRLTTDKTGNYCFRRRSGTVGGTLLVEVNGIEATRRALPSFGPAQQREDFEIYVGGSNTLAPPGVLSTKFFHPQNQKTIELYKKTAEAEKKKDIETAIGYLNALLALDPDDFIAWAKLGTLYFESNLLSDADAAFRRSLELRVDYIPAWINVGKIRVFQKQYESAIEIFKHAVSLDPTSARAHQLLGQTYLQTKLGTLGAEALKKAIELDPIGMAECHLLIARLYDLAGAKQLASKEYKIFLTKVTDHPDKKKFEKYIKDNPEEKEKD